MMKFLLISLLGILPGHLSEEMPVISEVDSLKSEESRFILPPEELITDEYLDTVIVDTKKSLNDYSMIGIHYGAQLSNCIWSPSMPQKYMFNPVNVGITYTRYGKMFGYMPYFGFQIGVLYAQEGYKFKKNKEDDYIPELEGATSARLDVIEIPFMAHCHIDFWKMKLLVNLGLYGGYRLGIHRYGENVKPELERHFKDTDIRFDYGIKGGIGFGIVFDPIEIHIQAMYKYSMSNLYKPNYSSEYYYKFAYPNNIIIQAGIHFQLTKRTGKSRRQLRHEARQQVLEEFGVIPDKDK